MTGYDVHKVFATTPLAHFSASPGAIYPALRRLAKIGLLSPRLDSVKEARPRRVYYLTSAGREALDAWLHQPVTREELIRRAGAPVLRFSLAGATLTRDEVLAYLDTYGKVLAAYIKELYDYVKPGSDSEELHGTLAVTQGIRGLESELEWTKWAAREIRHAGRGSRKPHPSR
jgi:DNA-binding PadR family transcriptional regulator